MTELGVHNVSYTPVRKCPSSTRCSKGKRRLLAAANNPQWVVCLESHGSPQTSLSSPLSNSASRRKAKSKFVEIAASGSNERKALIYRSKGRLSKPETCTPRGEPWEVTTDVRCPCEVREIKILPMAELVQRQQDHTAPPGSWAPMRSTLMRLGSAVAYHTVEASWWGRM